MKKIINTILLGVLSTICLSGCVHRSEIKQDIKNAFAYVSDTTDEYAQTMSYLSSIEKKDDKNELKQPSQKSVRFANGTTSTVEDCSVSNYIIEQMFALYIFHNVEYCVRYAFEPNGVYFGDNVHGRVHNEVNSDYRKFLILNNGYTDFYMTTTLNDDNSLSFNVDWKRWHNINKQEIPDNDNYHGCIYVNGKITRDENDACTTFFVNCHINNNSSFITSSYFDFVNDKVYFMHCNSSLSPYPNNEQLVKDFNSGTLTYEKIKQTNLNEVIVANGNITKNYLDADYVGYRTYIYQTQEESSVNDEAKEREMEAKYNKVYKELYPFKLRSDKDAINYSQSRTINCFDDVLAYGLNRTKTYITKNGVFVPYITKNEMINAINEHLNNNTLEAKVREGFQTLISCINAVKEEDFTGTFENVNNCSLYYPNSSNYRLNSYSCQNFYYSFKINKLNGLLFFNYENFKIVNARFENIHKFENTDSFLWEYDKSSEEIEDILLDNGWYERTITVSNYRKCLDCGKDVCVSHIERKYLLKLGAFEDIMYPTLELIQTLNVNNNQLEYTFSCGQAMKYFYNQAIDDYCCYYECSYECNQNTNFEVYPMYERYLRIQVEERSDGYLATLSKEEVNNWLKITQVTFMDTIECKYSNNYKTVELNVESKKWQMPSWDKLVFDYSISTTSIYNFDEYERIGLAISTKDLTVTTTYGDRGRSETRSEQYVYSYEYTDDDVTVSYTINGDLYVLDTIPNELISSYNFIKIHYESISMDFVEGYLSRNIKNGIYTFPSLIS